MSTMCLAELRLALDLNKPIIPLWHSGSYPPPKLVLRLSGIQSTPSSGPFNAASDLESVAASITQALKRKGFSPTQPAGASRVAPAEPVPPPTSAAPPAMLEGVSPAQPAGTSRVAPAEPVPQPPSAAPPAMLEGVSPAQPAGTSRVAPAEPVPPPPPAAPPAMLDVPATFQLASHSKYPTPAVFFRGVIQGTSARVQS
ncbi:hypothetical protein FOA52_014027 [Chlamydomonas sp. UWO 241]|nr:hypothetical protein FOA52_014027 [Chlamydomonas sp. UWO 241]